MRRRNSSTGACGNFGGPPNPPCSASWFATICRAAPLRRLSCNGSFDASGARAQFNAYLASAPSGTLAEEARVGLALSAAKLGDAAGERAAWQDLLDKHPQSVHAERARKRIAELGP